jgi:DNA polymerase III sliding clamp (beta) subunit (PCNA family)
MHYITSAFEWKILADTLKDILTECFFVFNEDTISMNNVDPEKVVNIYYEVKPAKETYSCDAVFHFPVYIQTVYRVLRGVKQSDTMEMMDNTNGSMLLVIYSQFGAVKNRVTLQPLQEMIPTYIRNPKTYNVGVTILNEQFYHILHDLAALSRQVRIHVQDQMISFSAQDESGTTSAYDQVFQELDPKYFFNNVYILKFMEKFTKPGIQKFCNLRIDHNLPLSVVYYLENGSLEMTIAGLE